jgi:hypothetical protein
MDRHARLLPRHYNEARGPLCGFSGAHRYGPVSPDLIVRFPAELLASRHSQERQLRVEPRGSIAVPRTTANGADLTREGKG